MWFKFVGITGESGDWTDADMEAAFSLLGLEFDYLLTSGDDQVSKLARRYAYNNKLHKDFDGADTGRVRKVRDLVEELEGGGILLIFAEIILADLPPYKELEGAIRCKNSLQRAMDNKIPVIIFPTGFRQKMEEKWTKTAK